MRRLVEKGRPDGISIGSSVDGLVLLSVERLVSRSVGKPYSQLDKGLVTRSVGKPYSQLDKRLVSQSVGKP